MRISRVQAIGVQYTYKELAERLIDMEFRTTWLSGVQSLVGQPIRAIGKSCGISTRMFGMLSALGGT